MYWMTGTAVAGSGFIGRGEQVFGFVDIADDTGVVDRDALDRILREQRRGAAIAAAARQRRQVGDAEHHWMAALPTVLGHNDQVGRGMLAIACRHERANRRACDPWHVGKR